MKAVQNHSAEGQFLVSGCYYQGKGVQQDMKEAFQWFSFAAKQGDAEAQYTLGLMYDRGCGVAQNLKEAFKLYSTAAQQQYAPTQNDRELCMYMERASRKI